MENQTTYLGVGFYSYAESARIIGIPVAKLRRWVRDYDYYTNDFKHHHSSVIHRRFTEEERILSFLELIELLFISLFRQEGVSLHAIRKAAFTASKWFSTDYPFAMKRFSTDGQRIFATLSHEAESASLIAELGRGQLAFPTVIEPFLRKIEYRGDDTALAFWPLGREERVVLDPNRSFGKPIDAETGVPTSTLYQAFKAEGENSISRVASWYEVPVAAVEAAIAFERSLQAA